MKFFFVAFALLLSALCFISSSLAVYILFLAQGVVLFSFIKEGRLSGAGGFVFMSFLFFAVRPLYILREGDFDLFLTLFRLSVDTVDLAWAMWWATAALLCFRLGSLLPLRLDRKRWMKRAQSVVVDNAIQQGRFLRVAVLILIQIITAGLMMMVGGSGFGLYESLFGAYAYELPIVLQAAHIFSVIYTARLTFAKNGLVYFPVLVVSVLLFGFFTWEMRSVSLFRGFYLTGVMICGISALAAFKKRVGYAWLIVPILVLLPFFRILGEIRFTEKQSVISTVTEEISKRDIAKAYWTFFDSDGDMNIFDSFVAATKSEPAYRPYALSWLYVPLHFVPRSLWPSKPEKGLLVDVSYSMGAPYWPGIAGLFWLDGGYLWMLLSMGLLGYIIRWLDHFVETMPRSSFKFCIYGVLVINGMFLSRFFLYQYFYNCLYAIVPCFVLAWLCDGFRLKRL